MPRVDAVPTTPAVDLCPIYGKPLDLVDVDTKERICSSMALFGKSKGHDVREE